MRRTPKTAVAITLIAIILFSTACQMPALPGRASPTPGEKGLAPTQAAAPSEAPVETLPPTVVEATPNPASELPLDGTLTIAFNQPMDRASVEAALEFQPGLGGAIGWVDDTTLTFTPDTALAPASQVSLTVETTAKAANGLALTQPVQLSYRTVDYLRMSQGLPAAGATEVDPTSAIVAAFNRPLVALGDDGQASLVPFTLDPPAEGRGEWVNTSTYVFYPDPALAGGKTYTVQISPDLVSTDSAPLDPAVRGDAAARSWSFTTAIPQVLQIEPTGSDLLRLDEGIALTFNQPMEPASVEQNISILDDAGAKAVGTYEWNEDQTKVTFQPTNRWPRNAGIHLTLLGQAQGRGGTPIGVDMSTDFTTFPELQVLSSEPVQGGVLQGGTGYNSIQLHFSAPLQATGSDRYVDISPAVPNLASYVDETGLTLYLSGYFSPNTPYTLTVSANLPDAWARPMGTPYTLNFQTGPAAPGMSIIASMISSGAAYLTTADASLRVSATNIASVNVARGTVTLPDFFKLLGPDGYTYQRIYSPGGLQNWSQAIQTTPNQAETVEVYLSEDHAALGAGLYYFSIQSPELMALGNQADPPFVVVVSPIQLILKVSASQALVWATRVADLQPVAGASVSLYDEQGNSLGTGITGSDGLLILPIEGLKDPYQHVYAVLGEPGQADFSLAVSTWNAGINSWDFGLTTDLSGPRVKTYLYTDRPIYRPGDTVYFKAVVRKADNGRYSLADLLHLPVEVYADVAADGTTPLVGTYDLALNAYGTGHGSFTLPEDAAPGYYRLHPTETPSDDLYVQVANYRKPEIDLKPSLSPDQVITGQDLQATIQANYFFGAPAGNLPVHWTLYRASQSFLLQNATVGAPSDYFSLYPYNPTLGQMVSQGDLQTQPDGRATLNLPTSGEAWFDDGLPQTFTLEVTITDSSNQPVSARASATVHPADFYIGIQPDSWTGNAGTEMGFGLLTAGWSQQPVSVEQLTAHFSKVTWEEEPDPTGYPGLNQIVPKYDEIGSANFATDESGKARVSFTPPDPGTYALEVEGKGARSRTLLWVNGAGEVAWPNLPNQRLELNSDTNGYRPGQTAKVFIPNPFGQTVQALITVERGKIQRQEIVSIEGNGKSYDLALSEDDAPNVYVAVTLLGKNAQGTPDFRQGFLEIKVEPLTQTLNVELAHSPDQIQPGGEVTLGLRVTDLQGQPVRGEFSIAVVDLAALALADANEPGIVSAFYRPQPLGVRTAVSLAAYARRSSVFADGQGGGGGGAMAPEIREDFRDTAYWNAEVITDANGEASVSIKMPENLTSWQVDVRGLTADTRVGAATTDFTATKDLLVRPVTPRFFVAGDRVELAAVVHNNTAQGLDAEVTLQSTGFTLEDPSQAAQTVNVPAGGQTKVTWWGVVAEVPEVDLIFSASAGNLSDAARPEQGKIPVYRYTSPQTYATAGLLSENGERLEVVSLPRSFSPTSGELRVELSPSLISAMLDGLSAFDLIPYQATEATLSRLLPNLETRRIMTRFGVGSPELQAKLDSTINESISRLLRRQNLDGGWSWASGKNSDTLITAYILIGLSRARKDGIEVNLDPILRGQEYLKATLFTPDVNTENWQIDRQAFIQYALEESAVGDAQGAAGLFEFRERMNPWGRALLAVTLESLNPGDEQAKSLISDLEASAIRSATGAHWEVDTPAGPNLSSAVTATAIVTYAIAQRDPAAEVLPEAVRYIMSNRRPGNRWSSTYESAWALLALGQVLEGTGELDATYNYYASLNGTQIVTGQAQGTAANQGTQATLDLSQLHEDAPNALRIGRDGGAGQLYYTAALDVYRPAESAPAVSAGMSLDRAYTLTGVSCRAGDCATIDQIDLNNATDRATVRLTLTLPHDAYHLTVEDWVPAGAEILDPSLQTSQQGLPGPEVNVEQYDPRDPYSRGWGWWYFDAPQVRDERITWTAEYLPAGTYVLTYTFVPLQAGDYQVIPAHAWQMYFPEVQATSAGDRFTIIQ